jgi:tetratricopeptide (TPR) repeat protein
MITIATYNNLAQADIAKGRLETEGIKAFIADEAQYTAGYGPVVGPVRLQVDAADVERANGILSSLPSVALPEDFDGPVESTQTHASDLSEQATLLDSLEGLSRQVHRAAIALGICILVAAIYLSFALRPKYESAETSWLDVYNATDRNDFAGARKLAEELIEKTPGDYRGHNYLAYIYVAVGDLTNAAKSASTAFNLFPTENYRQDMLAVQKLLEDKMSRQPEAREEGMPGELQR